MLHETVKGVIFCVLPPPQPYTDFMTKKLSAAESALRDAAREYHAQPSPGKITVRLTKPL